MEEVARHREGVVSPDTLILIAAAASLIFSVYLWFGVNESYGLFAATWVPSILAFGCFIKISRGQKS